MTANAIKKWKEVAAKADLPHTFAQLKEALEKIPAQCEQLFGQLSRADDAYAKTPSGSTEFSDGRTEAAHVGKVASGLAQTERVLAEHINRLESLSPDNGTSAYCQFTSRTAGGYRYDA